MHGGEERPTTITGRVDADPHDDALQRLFGVGLTLQSTLTLITDPVAHGRVRTALAVLNEIIDEIRSVLPGDRDGGA